jgi:RHS repeat-associated protein
LVSVTDAINQVTTLSYDLASDPLKITKVTDPFGRFATFAYDDVGQLIKITDVIGLSSEFEYGANLEYLTGTLDFIRALTTPYGTTTFRSGIGPYDGYNNNRWLEATDPLGGTERVEHILAASGVPLAGSDSANTVPTGFTGNSNLNTHLAIYYSKLAMDRQSSDPPDPEDGEIFRFRSSNQFKISAYQLQSTKLPLENRVWYEHQGETLSNGVGSDGRPAKIGRVLDDGSSQIYRYEYNSNGFPTRYTDPVGRETLYEYASNEIDFLKSRQKNGVTYDLLQEFTYNSGHQPLTVKGSAGQTTSFTYNAQGQLLTLTRPPRAGITENRTTTYSYTNGYLQTVTGPAAGATKSFTYDSYGRTRTIADSDSYTLTFDYDALDRQTKVTFPDATFEEIVYEKLDPARERDRLGRWTNRVFDSLRRLSMIADSLGRIVTQQWCSCGSLDVLVDPNGYPTTWERDIQGRITKEIRANGSEWLYGYENTTSRLKTVTDPKNQVKTYSYFVDNNLQGLSYTNEETETPNVTFSFDAAYNRLTGMVDGTGTTTYGFHPVGSTPQLGSGRLATVNGPLNNDIITYAYDERGRVVSRAVNGAAVTYEYDALGRIFTENNVLGTFSYQYEGVTSRLRTVTYPNGQTSIYAYYPNSGDHHLQEIHHRKPGGVTLSKLNYSYDAVGNIKTWTQQQDVNPAKAYDFEYDRADEIRTAVWRTTDATPTILKRYAYTYDPAGNRTVEQIDNAPVLSAYDSVNRLTSQTPGGTMRFAGTLNEAATVTIQGLGATVTGDNRFERAAQVSSGTSQVVVKAKDYAGNERTNTYEVSVSGSSKTFSFDANGNMTADGVRTFEWDAENRLRAIAQGILRTEFTYDGTGRGTRITELENQSVTSDRWLLWCGEEICEHRNPNTSAVLKQYFRLGVKNGSQSFFYARDHQWTIREMTNDQGTVSARYEYDPYGRITKTAGSEDSDFVLTGHLVHPQSSLILTMFRIYSPETGRWLSEDPYVESGRGTRAHNRYLYLDNSVVNFLDPDGLMKAKPGTPLPGGPLRTNLECLDECLGTYYEIRITETTENHPPGNPHTRGEAADFTVCPRDPFLNPKRPLPTRINHKWVLCCARACSFEFSIYHPPGDPRSSAPHFHVQIPPGRGGAVNPPQTGCNF